MLKVEHIGIAVKNLEKSNVLFQKLFGKEKYKVETVESEQVSTAFFQIGETKIELLESTDPDSAIGKYIEKRGEGIHHIDRKSTRLNSSHRCISYAVFCLKKKNKHNKSDEIPVSEA